MSLSTYCEEHTSLYQLLEVLHVYILEEYEHVWEKSDLDKIPKVEDIVKKVYENLYDEISQALIERIQQENEQMKLFRPAKELYSAFFDQHLIDRSDSEKRLFDDICKEVEKFFVLYQIVYRRENGEITNYPVLEVW